MLPLERQRRLLELLSEHQSLRTPQLARQLGVTQETVRRDFERLEREGVLQRTHGGAVRLEAARREFPVRERAAAQAAEKRRIAQAALGLVESGQTVFFDPSTTVQALASLLPDRPLTVLTNSLQIPLILAEKPEIRVIVLGGSLRAGSLSCTGLVAEQAANFYRIDAAFLSCRGLDLGQGLSEATEEQARLKRHLVARARRLHLLADASKVGVASSFFFADAGDIDVWITDAAPPDEFRLKLEARGVRIEVAEH
jgi:DeoR/GlpR family transcriptional regulator of sugar metabolism